MVNFQCYNNTIFVEWHNSCFWSESWQFLVIFRQNWSFKQYSDKISIFQWIFSKICFFCDFLLLPLHSRQILEPLLCNYITIFHEWHSSNVNYFFWWMTQLQYNNNTMFGLMTHLQCNSNTIFGEWHNSNVTYIQGYDQKVTPPSSPVFLEVFSVFKFF